jgi:hypothetical protein
MEKNIDLNMSTVAYVWIVPARDCFSVRPSSAQTPILLELLDLYTKPSSNAEDTFLERGAW